MMLMVMASAMSLAMMQASISAPRSAFVACLNQADGKAEADKVAVEGYSAYLLEACTNQASSLKKALVSFDVKNGVARKTAAADADTQINDYVASLYDDYQIRAELKAPKTPVSAPPTVPASAAAAPQEPQQ